MFSRLLNVREGCQLSLDCVIVVSTVVVNICERICTKSLKIRASSISRYEDYEGSFITVVWCYYLLSAHSVMSLKVSSMLE